MTASEVRNAIFLLLFILIHTHTHTSTKARVYSLTENAMLAHSAVEFINN